MKPCKDCKHLILDELSRCKKVLNEPDPVTGVAKYVSCCFARTPFGHCGEEGINFVLKEA